MHSRAKTNTTAPPRFRVAIAVALLAMLALFLGLAAPPAAADTGQNFVLTAAPPPDLDVGLKVTSDTASPQKLQGVSATIEQLTRGLAPFEAQPVAELDTSPPADSVARSVASATVEFAQITTVASKTSLTSGQTTNKDNGAKLEPQKERTALEPESALTANQTVLTESTLVNEGRICYGSELVAIANSLRILA